ncbi:MAG TPA: TetR/AcrR family transcriptional regulator [Acidimicrobiales bacterium]|nr:TetR/AcrR family transcriptional regulator [Acidimicrobiales bacterium]
MPTRTPSSDVVRPPRGRPRSEPTRRAILAAAIDLTSESGFDALSMDAIASRAGASKATIYRWWRDKVGLVAEAVNTLADEAVAEPDTGTLDGDVRSALDDLLAAMASPLGRVVEALAIAARANPSLHQALEEVVLTGRREMVARVLRRAGARGELREGIDPGLVADVVVDLLFYRIHLDSEPVEASRVEAFVKLLAEGLRRQP